MRCFITGATGFVGSYLLRQIVESGGHETAVLLRPGSDVWRIADLVPHVTVIRGDLTDLAALRAPLAEFAPDAVLHLAWYGVLNTARNDPRQTDNIGLSLELVKLAHAAGARHWIGLGSQAEYGPCSNRIDEQTPTRPTTLYGASKLAVALAAERLSAELGMRFAWLRLFSSYGPQDHPAWMIPYLILSLLRGERPALTAGEQLWDYIFVADAAEAIYRVAQEPAARGIFNLGSGQVQSIRRSVEMIRDLIDPSLPLGFGEVPYRPDQVMHLEANIEQLRQATGWTPRTSMAEGLARTVAWYKEQAAAAVAVGPGQDGSAFRPSAASRAPHLPQMAAERSVRARSG